MTGPQRGAWGFGTTRTRTTALRERGIMVVDRASRESSDSGSKSINTNANAELVYSHRLKKTVRYAAALAD
jgi:hypothetical protein